MNRRKFIATSGVAAVAASAPMSLPAAPAKPVLMKLGCQSAPTNEKHVGYLARYGVRNICGYPETEGRIYATVAELKGRFAVTARFAAGVVCAPPPYLTSSHIDREKHPAVMLAQSPERD